MSKHTQGPWTFTPEEGGLVSSIDGPRGQFVAEFIESPTESDAMLMAAAPDLLDALIHLEHNARKSGACMGIALEVARDAIAKATGEQV